MEPAEDTSLVAAIQWLVGTILGVLLMDKLDAWVRGVKLDDDVAKLKFEVERAELLVDDVRGRAGGNKSLARSLAHLKELLYDADDMVDELDYYRLQQQVEGVRSGEPEGIQAPDRVNEMSMRDADTPKNSSVGKTQSLVWNHFRVTEEDHGKRAKAQCNYCEKEYHCESAKNGTTGMRSHMKKKHNQIWIGGATVNQPNPSSTGEAPRSGTATEVSTSSSRKRRRPNEEPAQTTTALIGTPWDKAELSNRIKTVTCQLQGILETLNKDLDQHGSGSASSSNHRLSTITDKHRTSSLVPGKVYGRVAEKDCIINLITEDQSDVLSVLPIVGIAGVGKTALTQLVYNDPKVKSQFHHRIWVWVSCNFDEVRITREMLDFVSPKSNEGSSHRNERHEGICSFAKLQEILKEHMEYPLKKFLLVLDDVWDDLDNHQWNKLLAPLIATQVKGNVILITTRNLSVAKRKGTLESMHLCALPAEDFWLLFRSHAFGNEDYKGNQSLNIIGRKIAEKLKGNPLAAETAGELLRKELTLDHWSNILRDEHWKSLQLSRGIMPAIKLSYDQLPYHLQQCFSYTSIFRSSYQFLGKELVHIWISQGFVNNCGHPSKRLEDIAQHYLTELVNLGFFQQVEEKEEEEESSLGSQIRYSVCGLMNDFARMVSRTECATIDGLQCSNMLPTIRHMSIVNGTTVNLTSTITSVRKLRTLVLLGDSLFFKSFIDIFRKAKNLRMLHMSATSADFNSFQCNLINPTHLRYLKREPNEEHQVLPQVLSKLYHLQVLDIGSYIDPDGINNLVSLRHLVVDERMYNRITSIGSMTSLQELQNVGGSEITQLQSMNELVELGMFRLDGVESQEEAYGAGLRDKVHLAKLHLSWKDDALSESESDEEYSSDHSSRSSEDLTPMDDGSPSSELSMGTAREVLEGLEPHMNELVELRVSQLDNVESREEAYGAGLRDKVHLAKLHLSWKDALSNEELMPVDYGGPSSEPSMDTAREMLEGLEPHMNLKHLQISGYNGATSPAWLARNISVTSLQTLHLDGCRRWRILPSLESLPFIRKLKFRNMHEVTEVLVPSLEELVLIRMPKLVRCSSTSVEGLSSVLRALEIRKCRALKEFDLFENDDKLDTRQRSWLPGLRKLVLSDCPHLKVSKPLPPSTISCELHISGVSVLPSMKGLSSEMLYIGNLTEGALFKYEIDVSSDELRILNDQILAFDNLRNLKSMRIAGCRNLRSFSLEGFSHLVSLKSLKISLCRKLFCSDVMSDATLEDLTAANWKAFPCLESLSIEDCGIGGKWLSLLLRHAPDLEELYLENILPSKMGDSLLGEEDDALTGLAHEGLVHIPLNLTSSLKKITIEHCRHLTFNCSEEGFSGFTSLQELIIWGECAKQLSSLVHTYGNDLISLKRLGVERSPGLESLQLHSCTALEELTIKYCKELTTLEGMESLRSLKMLVVEWSPGLESLQLHSCMALEELTIKYCGSLIQLEGLQSLGRLRYLAVSSCPVLGPCLEGFSRQGRELFPRLETLETDDDPSVLTMSFCNHLTSLRRLRLRHLVLSEEQGRALVLLTSLQELEFYYCPSLVDLPAGLHLLPSLKRLKIFFCRPISRLPETSLPLSLEELEIEHCSKELADQCKGLETSKLRVTTNECW